MLISLKRGFNTNERKYRYGIFSFCKLDTIRDIVIYLNKIKNNAVI